MVAEIGNNRLSGPRAAIESSPRCSGGRCMTRSADEINERADREHAKEHRSYVEGVQLGDEAILKDLLSSVIAIYDPETAIEESKIINQIKFWALRSLTPANLRSTAEMIWKTW